jgi:DnaJ-class molecular chaperone
MLLPLLVTFGYLWVPLVAFGCLWLPLVAFVCLWLPLVTFGWLFFQSCVHKLLCKVFCHRKINSTRICKLPDLKKKNKKKQQKLKKPHMENFYSVLKISNAATAQEIKKAYRDLVLVWHPDKNPHNVAVAETTFKKIAEAHAVLSNPSKRSAYDKELQQHSFAFFQQSQTTFEQRTNSARFSFRPRAKKVTEIPVNCKLEELFTGVKKTIKMTRQRVNHGSTTPFSEMKTFEMNIRPGSTQGTLFFYEEEGDQLDPDVPPNDIRFVIIELEHKVFARANTFDLSCVMKVELADILFGRTFELNHLDGRITPIVFPAAGSTSIFQQKHPGLGMPVLNSNGSKGLLTMTFELVVPCKVFSDDEKRKLKALLSNN